MARILLVDDDQMLRDLLLEVLSESGHVVSVAESGSAAYKLCQNQSFDLILTDIVMPDIDGIEVIQEMMRSYPGMKIIAMSGGGRCSPQDYLEIAGVLGASSTIAKPFACSELIALIEKVLST